MVEVEVAIQGKQELVSGSQLSREHPGHADLERASFAI